YYTMKERAGVVGGKGLSMLLDRLRRDHPDARLHLVGHSFGGRAVTAAVKSAHTRVDSLVLLQAAFSHFGMAHDWDEGGTDGLFATVPAKVIGPTVVTFTKNDRAVGLAYAIASRLARQVGASVGDANDPYGGIGRNGALKTPASLPPGRLAAVGGDYAFQRGRVSSLNADAFITSHSDVTGKQVAFAILRAIGTT
ncbi:MAG: alpha/beta fold hydrolase, partial [Microbacterium sp.]